MLISILNYGDTENVLINHLLLVIPMSYPCHYTNLCPHKPHKHAHTHTHTHSLHNYLLMSKYLNKQKAQCYTATHLSFSSLRFSFSPSESSFTPESCRLLLLRSRSFRLESELRTEAKAEQLSSVRSHLLSLKIIIEQHQ